MEMVQVVENYLKMTGKLFYQILYVTPCEEPETLEGVFPFEEMIYLEEGKGEQYFVESFSVDLVATLIHSRKINVRTTMNTELRCETFLEQRLTMDVESSMPVYKKKRNVNVLELYTMKKDTYRIKEEMILPGAKESIGQLLYSEVCDRKLELLPEENHLSLKGELQVFAIYLTENGTLDWLERSVPYMGELPCEGVQEEMYVQVQHVLEDSFVELRTDEDGEMRILGVEGTLNLRMYLYQEEEIELLEDLYALGEHCTYDEEKVGYEELVLQNRSKYKLIERLEVPELKGIADQICYTKGEIQVDSVKAVEQGLKVEGFLHLHCLYLREDRKGIFGNWIGKVPFSTQVDCPKMDGDMNWNLRSSLEQVTVNYGSGGMMDVKAGISFDAWIRRRNSVDTIENIIFSEITSEELEGRPGMIGYIVKEGDSLWDVAKRYQTTEEQILNVNGLETEVLKRGQKLIVTSVDS